MDTLLYTAQPGQIKLGVTDDPLFNTEPAKVLVEGFAIPGHLDDHGYPMRAGFDVVRIQLAQPTEFRSATAVVEAPVGHQLVWKQIDDGKVLQWADEQAYARFAGNSVRSAWERSTLPLDYEVLK